MIFPNVVDYTSLAMNTEYGNVERYIGIDGPAAVYLEIKAKGDTVFRRSPQASFNGPYAGIVYIPEGQYRIVTVGAATTVVIQ